MDLKIEGHVEPAVYFALLRHMEKMQYPSLSSCVIHLLISALASRGYF